MDLNNLASNQGESVSELNSSQITGLTSKEVNERIKQGKVNYIPKAPSRTFWQICRANLFTSFNAINFILAAIIIIAGSPKNAIFAFVIIINSFVGISQEMKSKRTLEKLSVINVAHAVVMRNGKETETIDTSVWRLLDII